MDKLKKSLKHLFAPAIVLLLVAVMGIFSPVVSVVAALRVNVLGGAVEQATYTIQNLPARTIEVGSEITAPSFTGGKVFVCHAGKEEEATNGSKYTYNEIGQYEWRFYASNVLFNTYTVTVTDTAYGMVMPENVATVAPKDLTELTLPLPTTYKVDGEAVEVEKIEKGTDANIFGGAYATITVDGAVKYVLTANVTAENYTFPASQISLDHNGTVITLGDQQETGVLKVTYKLYSADAKKMLAALPLSDIEIKNVTTDEVTFANVPTAPSVKNLAYYSKVTLAAPTADSAKVGTTSFNVEAQTKIFKVQCSPYATEPSDWSKASDKIHTLTVEKTAEGQWVVKENGEVSDKYLEVDGLTVKIKALGWYRFQFETSTLFGYQMDENFDAEKNNIENPDKTCVRYWSDSVRIYRDSIEPNFAWVDEYSNDNENKIAEMNENFNDLLNQFANTLPMTDKPDASTTKKITINPNESLVLPAIFPHDNATSYANMKVTTFSVEQIQNENGNAIEDNKNYVYNSKDKNGANNFVYDHTKAVAIDFVDKDAISTNNSIQLLKKNGLYRVRVVVEEVQPTYEDGTKYSGGYANSKTKYLYFYVDSSLESENNTPKIDESKVFQVSDVYLSEGHTFEFNQPAVTDKYTPTDKITLDYYLVGKKSADDKIEVLSQIDAGSNKLRTTVDLDALFDADKLTSLTNGTYAKLYIYAVARNFNAMQANFQADSGLTVTAGSNFTSEMFATHDQDEFAQFGYAWKRAEFAIHPIVNVTPKENGIVVTLNDVDGDDDGKNTYVAGKAVKISSITTTWNNAVDGQMSVAAYQVKGSKMIPVNIVNSDKADAEIVSSISSYNTTYTMENLYFTPGVSGEYVLVVSAKAFGSDIVTNSVTKITIESSGDYNVTPLSLSPMASNDYTVDKTIALGETMVLPNWVISKDSSSTEKYFAKNRQLYSYEDGVENGYYTVTVMGVNDPNCILGNKFVPNKDGKYVFHYEFFNKDGDSLKTVNYVVQVNNNNNSSETIRVGEAYDDDKVLWNAAHQNKTDNLDGKNVVDGQEYALDQTYTDKNPAYAITLNQFVESNYGAATDFVIDSISLYDFLEPIYNGSEITGYMYPAIAIPMPNLVTDTNSSDEVEITVQKSGNSNYLVSSKKKNAGGSADKASVIEPIEGYYVFRPEGRFNADAKNTAKYAKENYLDAAVEPSKIAGLYTVSYKTSTTSLTFNVTFGNLENGTLDWEKGFLTYNNNDGKGTQEITKDNTDVVIENIDGHRYVTIDMSKVYFTGNKDMEALIEKGPSPDTDNAGINPEDLEEAYLYKNVNVSVSFDGGAFIDSSDWSDKEDETEAIKITEDGKFMYKFDLSKGSGTYKVNISMANKYTGSTVSGSIEFTIDVDVTNRNHNLNNIWGIILIVLSVGLLAGVVFYFIKTARATRFVDVPRAAKGKVKAPKNVEASKEDVK